MAREAGDFPDGDAAVGHEADEGVRQLTGVLVPGMPASRMAARNSRAATLRPDQGRPVYRSGAGMTLASFQCGPGPSIFLMVSFLAMAVAQRGPYGQGD